jgi:hypothetical protein
MAKRVIRQKPPLVTYSFSHAEFTPDGKSKAYRHITFYPKEVSVDGGEFKSMGKPKYLTEEIDD